MDQNLQLMECLFVLLATYAWPTEGYSSGAGANACNTLRPGASHGNPSTDPSPYTVRVLNGVTTYTPGEKITIQVSTSGDPFQGLFLQARKADGSGTVGSWDSPDSSTNTKTMSCSTSSDTITHANINSKTSVTLTWNPPSSDMGNIKYTGVVSKEKTIWWSNQQSTSLTYKAGVPTSGSTVVPTSGSTVAPTSGSKEFGPRGARILVTVICAAVIYGKLNF